MCSAVSFAALMAPKKRPNCSARRGSPAEMRLRRRCARPRACVSGSTNTPCPRTPSSAKYGGPLRDDPGLVAVAVVLGGDADLEVRRLRRGWRPCTQSAGMICLPSRAPSLASSMPEAPPVAQRGVEAHEARLVAAGVDQPGGVGLGAHRLPDLLGQVLREGAAGGGAQHEAQHLALGRGVAEPGARRASARSVKRQHGVDAARPLAGAASCRRGRRRRPCRRSPR